MGQHIRRVGDCNNCGGPWTEIAWRDPYGGEEEVLERHCNQCGYAEDGEGNIRREGRSDLINMRVRKEIG